ncbi:TatD family hydrolase [Nocardioides aurantiacus]|uniref:TatD family hydrolase n=1 Tax=Nocardioides aurantiacus TaxID=86796 RepID=UPI00403FB78B
MTNHHWPPLDMHAHVDVTIEPRELLALRAVIFASSRSLTESKTALDRQAGDHLTIWGLGVHPGVKTALEGFSLDTFKTLLGRTAYVGEVGLDGKVKSRLGLQSDILSSILNELQSTPRITSLHSYAATDELLELLEETPINGAVLHWWLGDEGATRKAVELGAYFSVNPANLKSIDVFSRVPPERILTETDHPDGDKWAPQPRQPGNVTKVEATLARRFGISTTQFRQTCWSNLRALVDTTQTDSLLPERVRAMLSAM